MAVETVYTGDDDFKMWINPLTSGGLEICTEQIDHCDKHQATIGHLDKETALELLKALTYVIMKNQPYTVTDGFLHVPGAE